jgi:hypothetical protein
MSQAIASGQDVLVETLRERDCEYCSDGTLVEGTYKDNEAVVCDECETPALQLW